MFGRAEMPQSDHAQTDFQQRYRRDDHSAGAARIERTAREVLAELADPGSAASGTAVAAGLDLAELADARIQVVDGDQGFEPVATTILVSIAVSAGTKVAETLWTDVVWPRVRRRLGEDALGESVDTPGGQ